MSQLIFYYQRPEPATWVFLSSFLLLSIYFVFNRFLSIRNLDIVLLVLLAPGLMMVYEGRRQKLAEPAEISDKQLVESTAMKEVDDPNFSSLHFVTKKTAILQPISQDLASTDQAYSSSGQVAPKYWTAEKLQFWGFAALLAACGLLLVRMMIDPALVRRPLLIPNLSTGGLSFIGISLFIFLMGNIITSSPQEQELRGPQLGPGYMFLKMLPQLPTTPDAQNGTSENSTPSSAQFKQPQWVSNLARGMAVFSNLAIIISIVGVGYWHFDNVKTGIGCAVSYLLLPYAAQMTGNLEHVVPASLMTLALLAYRQPFWSGTLMGLAAGLVYYPFFLLPLWISFYWKRGLSSWLSGVSIAILILAATLLMHGWEDFLSHLSRMFGLWLPRMDGLEGIWGPARIQADFRLPVLVAFFLLSFSYAVWPSRKNLGTLISGTAAIMLSAQFWHGNGGGLYMAWFLPFVLLTIFRPNLDDRIATNVVFQRRASSA